MLHLPYYSVPIYQNAEEALRLHAIIDTESIQVAKGMLRARAIPTRTPPQWIDSFKPVSEACRVWGKSYYATHANKGTPILPLSRDAAIRRFYPNMIPLYGKPLRTLTIDFIGRITYHAYNHIIDVAQDPELFLEQVERYNMTFYDVVTLWGGVTWYTAVSHYRDTPIQPTISRTDLMTYARLGLNAAEVAATFGVDDSYMDHVLHAKDVASLVAFIRLLSVPYEHHSTIYWDGVSPKRKYNNFQPSFDQLAYIRGQMYPYVEEFTIDGVTFPAGRRRSIMEILTDQRFIEALKDRTLAPVPASRIMGMNIQHALLLVLPVLNMLTQRFRLNKKMQGWYQRVSDLPFEQWRGELSELSYAQYSTLVAGAYYFPLHKGLLTFLTNYGAYQMEISSISSSGFRFTYDRISEITKKWKQLSKNGKRK